MGRKLGRKRRRVTLPDAPLITDRVADRKATDLLRNAQVAPLEVDDPYEPGAKITVLRSTRRDPLGWMHAHGQVDEAQYSAGRAWQLDWERCEQGARAIDPTKEAVDGGRLPEVLTDQRAKAAVRLKGVAAVLERADDKTILYAFLADGLGVEQIALVHFRRYGAGHVRRFGERVRGILDVLAVFYGFSMGTIGRSDPRPLSAVSGH